MFHLDIQTSIGYTYSNFGFKNLNSFGWGDLNSDSVYTASDNFGNKYSGAFRLNMLNFDAKVIPSVDIIGNKLSIIFPIGFRLHYANYLNIKQKDIDVHNPYATPILDLMFNLAVGINYRIF
jgi:hypothetical protein